MKKKFNLIIEVDEKHIKEKYSNYEINYNSPEEFIECLIKDMQHEADTDMSKDGMREWGYSIKIKEVKS